MVVQAVVPAEPAGPAVPAEPVVPAEPEEQAVLQAWAEHTVQAAVPARAVRTGQAAEQESAEPAVQAD